jgi:hypothetical protein
MHKARDAEKLFQAKYHHLQTDITSLMENDKEMEEYAQKI